LNFYFNGKYFRKQILKNANIFGLASKISNQAKFIVDSSNGKTNKNFEMTAQN